MTNIDLTGVFPAMTTPFADDGRIDHETLERNAQRLEAAGVAGVVPVGSTGESATLTHDEHIEAIETVIDAVEDIPVIAGSGSNSTHEALKLSQRAADVGADGLLLISPYYNKPEPAGIESHYRSIADAVDVPQIIYNVPSRTGSNVPPETVAALASHENITGYKAASGDVNQISTVIEATRGESFSILCGDDPLTLPVCAIGGRGVISVAGNVEPVLMGRLVESALSGELNTAQELHGVLSPLFEQLFVETNPIPVKTAMSLRGHGPERLRRPLTPLSDQSRRRLETILSEIETYRREHATLEAHQ
jgi:4-hydroxy-tetrahydrodipicolinate synthase